jgi:hypothetical protein
VRAPVSLLFIICSVRARIQPSPPTGTLSQQQQQHEPPTTTKHRMASCPRLSEQDGYAITPIVRPSVTRFNPTKSPPSKSTHANNGGSLVTSSFRSLFLLEKTNWLWDLKGNITKPVDNLFQSLPALSVVSPMSAHAPAHLFQCYEWQISDTSLATVFALASRRQSVPRL